MHSMAVQSDCLEKKLVQLVRPLPVAARVAILHAIWDYSVTEEEYLREPERFDSYFRHYEDQCEQLSHRGILQLTHQDVLDIVELVKTQKRIACTAKLLLMYQNNKVFVQEAIEFSATAVLLLNVSRWKEDEYLKDFVHSHFSSGPSYQQNLRLPKSFNVEGIYSIAGIQVQWTSNIMDHLSLRNDDNDVVLFHHIGVLDLYDQSDL